MILGNQVQQAIHVAARLDIAELLSDGPRQVDDLAMAAGAQPDALRRLLKCLAGIGVFAELAPDVFGLSPMAELLIDGPSSMRPYALWSGSVGYLAFGGLEYSIRT